MDVDLNAIHLIVDLNSRVACGRIAQRAVRWYQFGLMGLKVEREGSFEWRCPHCVFLHHAAVANGIDPFATDPNSSWHGTGPRLRAFLEALNATE